MTVIEFPQGRVSKKTQAKADHPAGKQIVSVGGGIEAAIPRDQWNRPLIIPPDEGPPVAYRRASTVAEVLDDHIGLNNWKRRLIAVGLAQRPDLVAALTVAKTAKEIDDINEQAFEQAGGGVAARNGSTVHALTDILDRGDPIPKGLPANIHRMLLLYAEATARFTVLDSERFIVCDSIKVAGTYDRLLFDSKTGLKYIGDLKTGQKIDYHVLKTPAQVAVYAGGKHYDLDGDREDHGADHNLGVMIHLPWVDDPKDATCDLRWLDLRAGRSFIREAFRVEVMRKMTAAQTLPRMT